MNTEWFIDPHGNTVEPGSRPVAKLFVIDPDRELDREFILTMLTPDPWEQIVLTNVNDLAALAAFAGAYESRGQARKAGVSGPAFHGIEWHGTRIRSFCVWNPRHPPSTPPPLTGMSRKRLLTNDWWHFLESMHWVNRVA